MSGSSSEPVTVMARLHLQQIVVLVDILCRATLRKKPFVESAYNERAPHFHETLRFLKEIGWVCEEGNELKLEARAAPFCPEDTQQFQAKMAIAEAVTEISNPYQPILAAYLVQYTPDRGRIIHRPAAQSRLTQSAIRNFLMEVGIVFYQPEDDSYVLHERSAHLYLWAKNVYGATSKTEWLLRADQRDQLGTSAESVVLKFERELVGPDWCAQVQHVSAQYPGACFDIKSLRVNGGRPVTRFIEVKAVSADSFQFFWTAAEIQAASLLRRAYFLYLLPVVGGSTFDLSQMEMIEDPYETVYTNSAAWCKQENVIVCRRRVDT